MKPHGTEFVFVYVLLLATRIEFLNSQVICQTQLCNCISNFEIDCTNKGLRTIPEFAPSNTSVYVIDFFEDPRYEYHNPNHISVLYSESFKNISVEQIDLRSNRLTHIDNKAFAGVEQYFKVLCIEGDGSPVLNLPFLKGLLKLEELHLENFGLTDVSEDNPWKELTSLKKIRVKNCVNLTSLGNNTFVNMPNLTILHLENLPSLQTVSTAIQNVETLTNLTIYETSISHLDENSFKGLTKLQSLDLSKNYLQFIDHATFISIHETLEYLDLCLNNLSVSTLSLLTTIKWMNLKTLNLSQNPLTNLFEGFFYNMSTLWILILNQCKLSKIQNTTFKGLGNLISLDISMNEIVEVEVGSFLPTPNLTSLNLYNQHQVPSCHSLHSSGHSPLNLPPEAFWHLRVSLTYLYLGYNRLNLTDTYELVRSLSNLKTLGLNCVGLEEIPSYLFSNHSNLEIIYLSDNNLKKLSPHSLYGLSGSLRELYLNNNKLKTLYKCVLENFTRLQTLQLYMNDWICDCHVLWLYEMIQNRSFNSTYLKCTTPAVHKGRYLRTLLPSALVCTDEYFQSDCPIWFDMNITTSSQTSLQLTWSVSDKYLLSGYLLDIMNSQNGTSNRIHLQADTRSYIMHGLNPGRPYQICLLMVINRIVQHNLEACRTWEIQGPSSSKEHEPTQPRQTISAKPIIFKSVAIIGAVAFIIIVLAIIVILVKVSTPRKNIGKSVQMFRMQFVSPQQCDSSCTMKESFPISFCNSDRPDTHFHKITDNIFSKCLELTPVEKEKLRERCKILISTAGKNDVPIICKELDRSFNETWSPNFSETEGPQPGPSKTCAEIDPSLSLMQENWNSEEEKIEDPSISTAVLQEL